jgi:hypothetical protein
VTPRELLAAAIAQARPRCRWCGCTRVTVEDRPHLGPVPQSWHYAPTMASACPSLAGGIHARLVYEDLWAGLERYLGPPADYGDDMDLAVINDELAAL